MKNLEMNKIAASILLGGLVALLVGKFTDILYHPDLQPSQRGYQVEVAQTEDNQNDTPKEEEKIDLASLLAQANAENGKSIFKKCAMCHSVDKGGANRVGPNLWNIVGNKVAHMEDFSYSKAMQNFGGHWDYGKLYGFIHKPKHYMPGTKMSFVGIKKPQDIADVIIFLRSNSDNLKPLP